MQDIFSRREREVLEEVSTPVSVSPGEMIYFKGDPADKVYYIKKGARARV